MKPARRGVKSGLMRYLLIRQRGFFGYKKKE